MLFKPTTYQAYLLTKEAVILSDDGTEFKNTVLQDVCEQCGIKRLFSNSFHPQGNLRIENVHNFLKRTLTKFLESSDLEWDEQSSFAG